MRIEHLSVRAYGRLVDFERAQVPPGLVVVQGDNEAGKTTLASLLRTLLYGFHPVTDFPYRPWQVERPPEVTAHLRFNDGREAELHRKLQSQPQATLTMEGQAARLANRALPQADHVGADLYGALYAVTQANARDLGKQQRAELEDRLLGGFGSDMLRPAREVVEELEDRANKLWRPDRRGSPRDKQLREALEQVKKRRRTAMEREERLREAEKRHHEIDQRIDQINGDLAELQARIRRADTLMPVKRRLDHIAKLRRQVPDMAAASALPDGIDQTLRARRGELEQRQHAVDDREQRKRTLGQTREAFSEADAQLLEWGEALERWRSALPQHHQELATLTELQQEADRLGERLADHARQILSRPWGGDDDEALLNISMPDLKARIDTYQRWQVDLDRLQKDGTAPTAAEAVLPALPWWPGVVAGLTGLVLLGLGMGIGAWVWAIGLVGLVLGAAYAAGALYLARLRRTAQRQQRAAHDSFEQKRREAAMNVGQAREAVEQVLRPLPIAEALLERPDLELHRVIAQMQEQARDRSRLLEDLKQRHEAWREQEADLGRVLNAFGERETSIVAMERAVARLGEVRERRKQAQQADDTLPGIEEQLAEARDLRDQAQGSLDDFLAQLRTVVGEELADEQALIKQASQIQETVRRIEHLEQQLADEHPQELEQIKREIADIDQDEQVESLLEQQAIEQERNRADDLQKEKDALIDERGSLNNEIEAKSHEETLGEVEGEIARLEEQRQQVLAARDRLQLLANALREADRRFREKHQPDVLQRASKLLPELTGGRYDRLAVIDEQGGEQQLHVRESATGEYRSVAPPLSHGTLDQIHLAFRFAAIEHLDSEHEPLPIVIDEALINWDAERFENGLVILQRLAATRQVFLFTCHEWLADRVIEATNAERLSLAELHERTVTSA